MKPAPFLLERPGTLDEALGLLAEHGDAAKLLAGGQSLVPALNFRLTAYDVLIDLNRISDLSGVRLDGDTLRIGAMTRQAQALRDPLVARHLPLMAQALAHVGHPQTRSRGTIGGSLAHADPSAELALVAVALDATLVLRSRDRQRSIAAREFFEDALVTAIEPDEMLTEVVFPATPAGARTVFRELARRHGDFAIVAVAAQRAGDALTVAVGGLEAVPRHCAILIDGLRSDRSPSRIPALIDAELASVMPLSDLHAGGDYRRSLAATLLGDCLAEVLA